MKKLLLLLTSLMSMPLTAGPFEDLCDNLGINEQFLQKDVRELGIKPSLLSTHIAMLTFAADESNSQHAHILRRLAEFYCHLPEAQWPYGRGPFSAIIPPYMKDFASGKSPLCVFLEFAREQLGGPKANPHKTLLINVGLDIEG